MSEGGGLNTARGGGGGGDGGAGMDASRISFAGARGGCTGCGLPANADLSDVAELNETGVSALDCERCGTVDQGVDAVYFPAHRLDGTHADICWVCVQTVLAMPTPRYVGGDLS